jgi:two-component system response regulator ChvI
MEHFKPHFYDIVITDIRMPGLNGFDLYRLIRKQDESVKVFFMTAFEVLEQEIKVAFPNLPPNSFITKPITIEKLVQLIESAPSLSGS